MNGAGALLALLLVSGGALAAPPSERVLELPRFGPVTLYGDAATPAHVAIFVSGDGGWNRGVVDMARALAVERTLVVGVDIRRYFRSLGNGQEACADFAVDFERLSQSLQKLLALPGYEAPVLIGYSSGATLVYATLVQAPPNTFRGAISLGFCPDLASGKAPCRRGGLHGEPAPHGASFNLAPAPALESPWITLQGEIDQVCDAARTAAFVAQVRRAEIVRLPKVGHGFSVPARSVPQLRASFERLARDPSLIGGRRLERGAAPEVSDLPLIELPPSGPRGDLLAIVISGDGGWASLDREVGGALAARGVAVVGLDSLRYFWTRRTPVEAGNALERILEHYLTVWQRERVVLIGYSRGADVLPFMASRLPAQLASRVAFVALLGPGHEASFEFHLADWLAGAARPESRPILPEIEKLGGRMLCVYGAEEQDSLCTALPKGTAILEKRPGGHHFGGDYQAIAERILEQAGP